MNVFVRMVLVTVFLWLGAGAVFAQVGDGPPPLDPDANYWVRTLYFAEYYVENGDTTFHFHMTPIPIYANLLVDLNEHRRLIRNLKIVYPIARYANNKLREMEQTLMTMEGDRRAQERYTKEVEKELKQQYTPIIKRMSFSQGKILIKLIDRETGHTSYQLVKDMRGNFNAFFWQNLGRLFGMNLKDRYDPDGEDRIIEQLITLYEAGLL